MQVNPAYLRHIRTKECGVGMDQWLQQELAISLALALRRKFNVNGTVLERVKVFKYLGRLLAQDDDDAQAIRQQMQKARGVWAQVGQVLRGENVTPWVATTFYKAVVQAILLYGSKTWNLTASTLVRLEGFHIRVAYKMVQEHQPRQGANHAWTYPRSTLQNTFANNATPLPCMWRHGLFWRHAGRANGKEGQCQDSGGGNNQ
jgi:hypothetical protein